MVADVVHVVSQFAQLGLAGAADLLLAPSKSALAGMCRSHLDDPNNPTVWTTPFELTKSKKSSAKKRTYVTPLPPLATRILKGVLSTVRHNPDDLVFPGLPRTGSRFFGKAIRRRPADFGYHLWRHTFATFLETCGRSEWERGLHSGSGVTAGYSHGNPTDLKRALLCEWAEHVEGLVQPHGAVVLR
jgi:integrase